MQVGTVSGVTVSNYQATSENGVIIVGVPESPVQNVVITDTKITLRSLTSYPGGFMDLRPSIYNIRSPVNDTGFYTEHVTGLQLSNVDVSASACGHARTAWPHAPAPPHLALLQPCRAVPSGLHVHVMHSWHACWCRPLNVKALFVRS